MLMLRSAVKAAIPAVRAGANVSVQAASTCAAKGRSSWTGAMAGPAGAALVGAGAVGGAAYALCVPAFAKEVAVKENAEETLDVYAPPATLKSIPREIVLYQYENCPFCCKVKAFLDFHKLPYRCVEVNPLTKSELKWSAYRKVPVATLDGEQHNDSNVIIGVLDAALRSAGTHRAMERPEGASAASFWRFSAPKPRAGFSGRLPQTGPGPGAKAAGENVVSGLNFRPAAPEGLAAVERAWRRWVDEWFVRVLTVNIYRTSREAWQTFDYITEHGNFSWWQRTAARVSGSGIMYAVSRRLRTRYGVQGDVREALFAAADDWCDALGGSRFMAGDRGPGNADIAMFGVLRSVVGTDSFNDVMQQTRLGKWYEAMFAEVGDSARLADARQ